MAETRDSDETQPPTANTRLSVKKHRCLRHETVTRHHYRWLRHETVTRQKLPMAKTSDSDGTQPLMVEI
ncbi:hypothetical protein PoB_001059800 [Plakobranchus ocellatus]|uniref:Uncharacterized protein n=1 Tax=Plakobranchus ocellatus TaxID=259542 RepID=A0AAV3YNF3_9GAST|nr:hypothetical protein PoB_001059800 [Plakobranchus ocellatus]